jgi:Arc/MetJ family transcription regulator
MRTSIVLDDELVRKAQEYTGVKDMAALIRRALTALVQREAARRLAAIGGSVFEFPDVRRRKAPRK